MSTMSGDKQPRARVVLPPSVRRAGSPVDALMNRDLPALQTWASFIESLSDDQFIALLEEATQSGVSSDVVPAADRAWARFLRVFGVRPSPRRLHRLPTRQELMELGIVRERYEQLAAHDGHHHPGLGAG